MHRAITSCPFQLGITTAMSFINYLPSRNNRIKFSRNRIYLIRLYEFSTYDIDTYIQKTYNNCMATKTFNLSLPEELVNQIDTIAKTNYMSRSELIKHAVIKELKSKESDWQTVVDFTKINTQGISATDILEALK